VAAQNGVNHSGVPSERLYISRHPEQWERFKQNPAQLLKSATEECLRYDSSVKSIQRIAAEDVDLRGKPIRKDDRVRWFISAANREPAAFENPDMFDIARYPNRYVAVWLWGASMPGGDPGAVRGPRGLPGSRGAVSRFRVANGEVGIPSHPQPALAQESTGHMEV
jgi:hypothetical protein